MTNPKRIYGLTVAIIAAFLAVAVFGVVSYLNTRTIRASERRVARSYAVRETANRLLSSIKDMQTGQRGYLLTGDKSFLQPYRDGLASVEDEFEQLRQLTQGDANQVAHLQQVRTAYEVKKSHLAKTIALRDATPGPRISDEVLEIVRSGRGEKAMERARKSIRSILDEEAMILADSEETSAFLAIVSESTIAIGHFLALGLIALAGFAAHIDRTKRDQAESLMLTQQNQLAAVIDSAFEGIIAFDDSLEVRLLNPAAAAMFGIDAHAAVGRSISEFIPIRWKEEFIADVGSLKTSKQISVEYKDAVGLRSDGSEFPYEGTMSRSVTDIDQFNTLKIRDLSEAKASEAKRREHVAILQQLRDAVLVCDLNDQILSWNEGAASMFGITESEAIGKNVQELLFHDRAEDWMRGRQAILETGKYSVELTQTTRDGRELFVEQRRSLIRDADNRPTAQLIFTIDATDRKRAEAKERRSQRLESIGTLAGGVAHDLNNVLTPILMSGKLLQRGSTNPERLFDTIVKSAERGSRMIKKLLAFAGGDASERQQVDVREILLELEEILSHTLPQTIDFQIRTSDELDLVDADSTELSQVVMNLAINARDAMPDGGQLTLEVRNAYVDQARADRSDNLKAGRHVLLSVCDTGEGIPRAIIDRIFDPFFTTKPQGKGTGLGLATTLGIVRSYGGEITVDSEPGTGTTFSIYLPSTKQIGGTAPNPSQSDEVPVGRGELILIVDDEAPIVETAREILESNNYRVLSATSGVDAIGIFRKQSSSIQLVFLDMMMPGIDGLDTKAAMRAYDASIRVIASSGLRRPGTDTERFVGINGFLAKPYSDEQLLRVVRDVLDAPTLIAKL